MDLACLSSATGRFPLFGILVYTRHVQYNSSSCAHVGPWQSNRPDEEDQRPSATPSATFGLIANGIPERTRNYVMRRR